MARRRQCALIVLGLRCRCAVGRAEAVGWEFESHGGVFPPLPWPVGSRVRDATVAYFLGNASGADSPGEAKAQAQFGIAGLGWQLGNLVSNFSILEAWERQTAATLRELRPEVRVLVTRGTQVVTVFWDSASAAMRDHPEYFLTDPRTGRPSTKDWVSPAGNTPKYWINFTEPTAAAWWEQASLSSVRVCSLKRRARPTEKVCQVFVGDALASYDGVYTDCACEDAPGVDAASMAATRLAAQRAFDSVLRAATLRGKWVASWNDHGRVRAPTCAADVRALLAANANAGAGTTQTLYDFRDAAQSLDLTVKAFLISRSALSATLEFAVTGVYDAASEYPWDDGLLDFAWGTPLSEALELTDGVFRRPYAGGDVLLNCSSVAW